MGIKGKIDISAGWPKCTDCTDFFCNPKIVQIVRIFFSNCTDCTDFYPGNTPVFLKFSFISANFLMKISKKISLK